MSAISTKPTRWDTSKYWIAVGTIITYLPAGLVAGKTFGPWGCVAAFLICAAITHLLRCSNCSWLLFKRGDDWWVPWPWRECPRCARPLVQGDRGCPVKRENGEVEPPNTSLERTRER
jgi:hypothetical protein